MLASDPIPGVDVKLGTNTPPHRPRDQIDTITAIDADPITARIAAIDSRDMAVGQPTIVEWSAGPVVSENGEWLPGHPFPPGPVPPEPKGTFKLPGRPETKLCIRCGFYRPLTEFVYDTLNTDGRSGWCLKCSASYIKQRREEDEFRYAARDLIRAGTSPDTIKAVLADHPAEKMRLPSDSAARKDVPMATGLLDYFPDALADIARLSKISNDKHNPGEPLHWSRHKSADHADCLMRHMVDRGVIDTDGLLHDTKVAWRALAQLQLAIERLRAAGKDY